jgi:hypothetical protein
MTKDELLATLQYHPDTGTFTRRYSRGAYKAGDVAGSVGGRGYRQIRVGKVLYYAHRLVWLMERGEFPPEQLDHINRNRDDNRIGNLRAVTAGENMQNTGVYKNNTSGFKGVIWDTQYGKWRAAVTYQGKQVFAGRFDTVYDAHQAYERTVAQLFTCR